MPRMETVIYVNGLERHPDKQMLSGARSVAKDHGFDLVSVPATKSADTISSLLRLWSPAGFIVNCSIGTNNYPLSTFHGTPVVFLGRNENAGGSGHNCLANDAQSTAELAAKELLSLHLETYAYVTWTKSTYWSDLRKDAFSSLLALHGSRPEVFDATGFREGDADLIAALSKWLKGLIGPVGVFAANDRMGAAAVHACRLAGLSVPDDVSIIGVDNDEEICESLRTSLSSISLNFFAAGQMAVEALAQEIAGKAVNASTYPPDRIVRRESTRRFMRPDKSVIEALELIRREACAGLTAKEVIVKFACSRRSAEYRFRAAVGHSILDEILRVRLEKAKELLKTTNDGLDFIASQCGYNSLTGFSLFFSSHAGMAPSEWRHTSYCQCQSPVKEVDYPSTTPPLRQGCGS